MCHNDASSVCQSTSQLSALEKLLNLSNDQRIFSSKTKMNGACSRENVVAPDFVEECVDLQSESCPRAVSLSTHEAQFDSESDHEIEQEDCE